MIAGLCEEVNTALEMGYTGFRGSGELSWALDLPSAMEQIVKYEESIEAQFYSKFAALCQYDESRYPAYITDWMKRLHPVVICNGTLTCKRPAVSSF